MPPSHVLKLTCVHRVLCVKREDKVCFVRRWERYIWSSPSGGCRMGAAVSCQTKTTMSEIGLGDQVGSYS